MKESNVHLCLLVVRYLPTCPFVLNVLKNRYIK